MTAQDNVNSALACAGGIANKLSSLEGKISGLENKISALEGQISATNQLIRSLESVFNQTTKSIENIILQSLRGIENILRQLIENLRQYFLGTNSSDAQDNGLTYQDMVNLIQSLSNKISRIESSIIEADNRNTNIILDTLHPSIERLDNVEGIARDILELVKSLRNTPAQQCKEPNLLPILGAISGVALSIGGLALALKGIEAAIRAIKINPTLNINLKGELEAALKPILNATLELNGKVEALKRCCNREDAVSPDLLKIVGDISSSINKSTSQIVQNDNRNFSEIKNYINNSTSQITNNDNRNTSQVTNTVNNSTNQVTNTVNNSTNQVTNTVNNSATQVTNNTSNSITQNIQEIIEIEYSVITVPVFDHCEDKQPIFKTETIAVQKGLEAAESLKFQRIAEIEGKQCGLETVALVPEWWQIRIEGGVPQFVVAFGEVDKDSGKCGHSKYAMTIPHFINQKPQFCPIPRYRKGNYELIAIFKDNSKLIINAFSEYECERVYFAILPWINSDYASSAKYKVGKRVSQPFKQIWVCPRFGKYFSTGNRDTNPDWTVYFE